VPGRILKDGPSPSGHRMVCLCREGTSRSRLVHHLVMEAFVGTRPEGMECRHLNGVPHDNRLSNLKWGTPKENQADRIGHGTSNRGSRHGMSKLTADQVRAIRRMSRSGATQPELASAFSVSETNIRHILSGRTWAHLKETA
jgi:hypothetical protein